MLIPGNNALLVGQPVAGYFMIKRDSEWRRLVIVDPPGTVGGSY